MAARLSRSYIYDQIIARYVEEEEALLRLSQDILGGFDPQLLLTRAAETALDLLRADACAVLLPDGTAETLIFRAVAGWESEVIGHVQFRIGEETAAGYAFST
ncbi:MAG: hypothetical protein HY709_03420, partial [Candidatus Latescibacteria bacterium]|nr:hypothetical protein [Candidatus Latescibacterota bacterium]